ncbi:hypothetical protein KIN20_028921 [Parelaphostrongylus tenuis]|uniref:Uncharacterized protein n=1 Tax=Parelaphostrongylus tenuis TaxID=148309 RepID=A0AAD5R1T0_PARTN|nr:hypothetical protein KIN20_028921 [Parelaphostrongylus tenuis]
MLTEFILPAIGHNGFENEDLCYGCSPFEDIVNFQSKRGARTGTGRDVLRKNKTEGPEVGVEEFEEAKVAAHTPISESTFASITQPAITPSSVRGHNRSQRSHETYAFNTTS